MILYPLLMSTLSGLSTLIGGLFIFTSINEKNINKFITLSLSFSLIIMIGISITDLIPTSTHILLSTYGLIKTIIYSLLSFLIGILCIKYLNRIIKYNENDLYKLGILNMLVLILHNLPEGIITFMSTYQDITLGLKLSLAIALHNMPEGISIAVPIYYATKSKKKALFKTFLASIAEPLGAILCFLFLNKYITNSFISIILLFTSGIMITLSIDVIYPKAQNYNLPKYLFLGIILGILVILINLII